MVTSGNIGEVGEISAAGQCEVTPAIEKLCTHIPGTGEKLVHNITEYVRTLRVENSDSPDFSRTADEIVLSGYRKGCNEAGIVFLTILRAKGVEATYIQAFSKEKLINYGKDGYFLRDGHVFLRTQISGKSVVINSTTGEITDDIPSEYVLGKEGSDSWDIGLRTPEDYKKLFEETREKLIN